MAPASEPKWLSGLAIEILHREQLHEHGGLLGVRDADALATAVARPRNKWSYGGETDICALAADYGYGIATTHPFVDGNKRAALLAIYMFLGINDVTLDAQEAEAVLIVRDLAAGTLSEDQLTAWLKDRVEPST